MPPRAQVTRLSIAMFAAARRDSQVARSAASMAKAMWAGPVPSCGGIHLSQQVLGVHMNWQVFTSALPLCLFSPVPGVFPLIESSLGRERPIENPYASKVRRKRRSIL